MSTTTEQIDLSKLSSAELEKLLAERKKAETQQRETAKKNYIKRRDNFIKSTVASFCGYHAELKQFKQETIAKGNELHDAMWEIFEREPRELKSFSLITEDGKYKLEIVRSPNLKLNETAQAGIEMIKECLKDKFQNRNKTMYNIIDSILMKNNKGEYDERLVTKLRKYEDDINDKRFSEGLDIISKAFYVSDTSLYIHAYKMDEDNKKMKAITIQFSAL